MSGLSQMHYIPSAIPIRGQLANDIVRTMYQRQRTGRLLSILRTDKMMHWWFIDGAAAGYN
jgi:hypothetical protein